MPIIFEYPKKGGIRPKISAPDDAAAIVRDALARDDGTLDEDKEHFYVIGLNGSNRVRFVDLVSLGTLSASLVHPREIFRRAIIEGLHSVIIAHNHPSGKSDPSPEDRAVTRQVSEAGKLLGIPLLDHVIVAGPDAEYSFAKEGLISP
jgi:DNA repair protein RadC